MLNMLKQLPNRLILKVVVPYSDSDGVFDYPIAFEDIVEYNEMFFLEVYNR